MLQNHRHSMSSCFHYRPLMSQSVPPQHVWTHWRHLYCFSVKVSLIICGAGVSIRNETLCSRASCFISTHSLLPKMWKSLSILCCNFFVSRVTVEVFYGNYERRKRMVSLSVAGAAEVYWEKPSFIHILRHVSVRRRGREEGIYFRTERIVSSCMKMSMYYCTCFCECVINLQYYLRSHACPICALKAEPPVVCRESPPAPSCIITLLSFRQHFSCFSCRQRCILYSAAPVKRPFRVKRCIIKHRGAPSPVSQVWMCFWKRQIGFRNERERQRDVENNRAKEK